MKRAMICFTRVPKPGQTKTRLLPILSGEHCAGLHTAFLRDLAQVYAGVEGDLFLSYAPDPDWEALGEIFPAAKDFFPQEGEDLGQRMHKAICRVLALGYDACVLTGADLPLMTAGHLNSGFTALEAADISIGPTSDGGYYLIGMKQPCPQVFSVKGYGGASVYEAAVAAAEAAGYSVAPATACHDVDTPEDLRLLLEKAAPGSHTGQYLLRLRKEGIL